MKTRFPFPFVQVTPLSQVLLKTSTKEDLFELSEDTGLPTGEP